VATPLADIVNTIVVSSAELLGTRDCEL